MKLIYNNTSVDTIAILMPYSNVKFTLPITLSIGTGTNQFINSDQQVPNVIARQSLNRRICKYTRPALNTGTFTLNPSSTALSSIREITQYQITTGLTISGILYMFNLQATQFDKLTDFSFTSIYTPPNRNRTLEDITIQFSSNPATAINLGFATALITGLINQGLPFRLA